MKQVLDLRPVVHRFEDRIRAHVLLCWLALLLIRIIETRATTTWPRARDELQRLQVGTFTGPPGRSARPATPATRPVRLHTALDIALPPRIPDPEPDPTPNRLQHPDQPQHPGLVTQHVTKTSRRSAPRPRPRAPRSTSATRLDRTGIARRGDHGGCRWVVIRHADDQVHIADAGSPG